jgi:hypothetical protein
MILNTQVEKFPSNIISKLFKFTKEEFFRIQNPVHGEVPKAD